MTKPWKSSQEFLLGCYPLRAARKSAMLDAAGVAALLLLFCGSCKVPNTLDGLRIVQVQSMTGSGANCTVPATASATPEQSGVLDVYLPDGSNPRYQLPLLITNDLDSNGGTTGSEMNNITLTHFTVALSAPGMTWPASCPATFDSDPFSILLAPAGGSIGYAVPIIERQHSLCLLDALDPQTSDSSPRQITVTATITAKGDHGGAIASAPFVYTVDVCTGCLQDEYTDPDLLPYNYPAGYPACAALQGTNPYMGEPCQELDPGQDLPILCCGYLDASGKKRAVCPAVFTGTATDAGTATSTSTSTSTSP